MNSNADPIEFLIEFAWANDADRFVVNNAKDELNKLQEDKNRWLSCEQELYNLRLEISKLKKIFEQPVAWGRTNDRGDLYDLRTQDNPYTDETVCVPLYSNKVEYKDFYAKFRKKYEQS